MMTERIQQVFTQRFSAEHVLDGKPVIGDKDFSRYWEPDAETVISTAGEALVVTALDILRPTPAR